MLAKTLTRALNNSSVHQRPLVALASRNAASSADSGSGDSLTDRATRALKGAFEKAKNIVEPASDKVSETAQTVKEAGRGVLQSQSGAMDRAAEAARHTPTADPRGSDTHCAHARGGEGAFSGPNANAGTVNSSPSARGPSMASASAGESPNVEPFQGDTETPGTQAAQSNGTGRDFRERPYGLPNPTTWDESIKAQDLAEEVYLRYPPGSGRTAFGIYKDSKP